MQSRFEPAALVVLTVGLFCLVWLTVKVLHGETAGFDTAVRDGIHSIASPVLTRVFKVITFFGTQVVVLGVSGLVMLRSLLTGRRDRTLLLVIFIGGAEFLEWFLKVQFHRPRPSPFFGVVLPESYSFPSGHALLSFCLYGMLATLARFPVRAAAAALILGIGISRIYLGVHYPTDVIGGYLVAIIWMTSVGVVSGRIVAVQR